jgi:tetratricopeptide (TPR) repeat protein
MAADDEFRQALEAFQSGDLDRALGLAERSVESNPTPNARHLLGLIHCRLGNPAAGTEHLRAAAEGEPANPAHQVMLARALVDAGRAAEALALPKPPPVTSPASLALWQARAEAADSAGNTDAAIEAWSAITRAAPRDWRAWASLGNALRTRKQWGEAANALFEAAQLNPEDAKLRADTVDLLLKIGQQNQILLQFDDAETAFRGAYELDPANASAAYHLGVALERTNRLDALEALLKDSPAAGIPAERLRYLWAALARRRGRLDDAAALLDGKDPGDDTVAWNALKSKVADALGDSDSAFDAATAMNRAAIDRAVPAARREEWESASAAYREEQRALARTITADWAARVPLLDEPAPASVAFLLGFPRSGTTLLDTFVLGHPQVEVLEEKQLVAAARQVIGPIEALPAVPLDRLREARSAYFERLFEHVGPGFSGLAIDKFPLDMGVAPVIQAILPRAPIIFAQRHPCDVVLSGFLQPFGMVNFSDIGDAADYYDSMMQIWTASREAMDLNVHTIVYEDLVREPEAALRPLVGFLGLDWDDRILDHQRTAKARGTIVTPSYDQVTEPLSTRPSGRWKRYKKQLEPVLPILLPWAERLGYSD